MVKVINAPKSFELKKLGKQIPYVFLAGPASKETLWRNEAIEMIRETLPDQDVVLLNPQRFDWPEDNQEEAWQEQVNWETTGLRFCDIVFFYIPKPPSVFIEKNFGKTTRSELTECLARGKKVVVGIDDLFAGSKYLKKKCKDYGFEPTSSLRSTVNKLAYELSKFDTIDEEDRPKFFVSDTHFGSERTLQLSRRPFLSVEDMDWRMVELWNNVVSPNGMVYHLGDIGEWYNPKKMRDEMNPLHYLNGEIRLISGNYERKDGVSDLPLSEVVQIKDSHKVVLAHEPCLAKEILEKKPDCKYAIFGHIHGRQKIKPFGIDVGVDSWNYKPHTEEDVRFFLNALDKGYYDKEVWIQ